MRRRIEEAELVLSTRIALSGEDVFSGPRSELVVLERILQAGEVPLMFPTDVVAGPGDSPLPMILRLRAVTCSDTERLDLQRQAGSCLILTSHRLIVMDLQKFAWSNLARDRDPETMCTPSRAIISSVSFKRRVYTVTRRARESFFVYCVTWSRMIGSSLRAENQRVGKIHLFDRYPLVALILLVLLLLLLIVGGAMEYDEHAGRHVLYGFLACGALLLLTMAYVFINGNVHHDVQQRPVREVTRQLQVSMVDPLTNKMLRLVFEAQNENEPAVMEKMLSMFTAVQQRTPVYKRG